MIKKEEYNESVDVWCIGILTYEMLAGRAPFENVDRQAVLSGIVNVLFVLFRWERVEYLLLKIFLRKLRSLSHRFLIRMFKKGLECLS